MTAVFPQRVVPRVFCVTLILLSCLNRICHDLMVHLIPDPRLLDYCPLLPLNSLSNQLIKYGAKMSVKILINESPGHRPTPYHNHYVCSHCCLFFPITQLTELDDIHWYPLFSILLIVIQRQGWERFNTPYTTF